MNSTMDDPIQLLDFVFGDSRSQTNKPSGTKTKQIFEKAASIVSDCVCSSIRLSLIMKASALSLNELIASLVNLRTSTSERFVERYKETRPHRQESIE